MTRRFISKEEFEALPVGIWFHSKRFSCDYKITETTDKMHKLWSIDVNSKNEQPDFCFFYNCENYDFEFGKHPETLGKEQPKEITCTVAEAINKGLNVGGKFYIEYELAEIEPDKIKVKADNEGIIVDFTMTKSRTITFAPTFTPKHDQICTVLTKEGLATKCKAYECNGEMYAIPLKNGKPDGIFNPEQISKFLKL